MSSTSMRVDTLDLPPSLTQDKFQTLQSVKEHFISKVDKVVMAKDY